MATVPQGTVQLVNNGANFGAPITLASDGTGQLITTSLPVGVDELQAVYTSSNGLNPSTSPVAIITIAAVDLNTATNIIGLPTNANFGDSVTINVAVTSV